jgi:CheY-like chemotaxis protein
MPLATETKEGAGGPPAYAPNVLLVDDLPANLLALEGALESAGLNLFRAVSGNEALRLALCHTFAVALIDVNMPGLDGFATASLLRLRPAQRDMRIFLTSADELPVARLEALVPGGADFFLKPIDPDVLRARVMAAAEASLRHEPT